jgi:hypothetical protein
MIRFNSIKCKCNDLRSGLGDIANWGRDDFGTVDEAGRILANKSEFLESGLELLLH